MTKGLSMLWLLIPLAAVGQMTQTIYVPAFEQIAQEMQVTAGGVQAIMAAYLVAYGFSQLLYGPLSDRFGRRPLILIGLSIFLLGSWLALHATLLNGLVVANTLQGCGIGVAGVMVRAIPRDLYVGDKLRWINSRTSMALVVSPLLAPLMGGILTSHYGWRACYLFLLFLGSSVWFTIFRWLPETRVTRPSAGPWYANYRQLLSGTHFFCCSLILACAATGIVLFEAAAGVLLGSVMRLEATTVSILFILPLPAAFLGSWYVGSSGKQSRHLIRQAVVLYLIASLSMWAPAWLGIMDPWTLLLPATLAFFAVGMLFPLVTTMAMQPFQLVAGSAGALIGAVQNIGAGAASWLSALLPHSDQHSLGLLMTLMSLITLGCWWKIDKHRQRC